MLVPSIFGEDLLDDFTGHFPFYDDEMKKLEKKLYGHHAKNIMKTDVKETDDSYELEMDLPGFKKEEIQISLENGYLTVSAVKGLDEDTQEQSSGRYLRKERYTGSCERTFYVGEDLTQEEIKAAFKHGILKLSVPKKDPQKQVETKKYISIE